MTDPTEAVPSTEGIIARAGIQPDPWAKEKALVHSALAALIAKLDETATRHQIVDETYSIVNALPLPPLLLSILNGARPVVEALADHGATK